jgi:FAD:protein FMN transferase
LIASFRNCPGAFAAALLLGAVLAAGCGRPVDGPETRHRFMAMGTLVDVTVYGIPAAEAEAAAREIEALFHELHEEWHPWGDGELGRLNQAVAEGREASPGPDLAALLAEAEALSEASGGLFDPTLGALVRLWGFDSGERQPLAPPSPQEIEALLATGATQPQLDLGGFLKGIAVDRGMSLLRARGIEHAIVNAGGDLRAIGRRGDRPWRIGIRAPRDATVLAALEIEEDDAVFTSGDYERFFEHEGRRYHHILDPRTGYPAVGLAAVSVVHHDAGRADAATTALMVAGPEGWPKVAAALGIEAVMVVHDDGAIELTDAMQQRIRFPDEEHARRARVRPLP